VEAQPDKTAATASARAGRIMVRLMEALLESDGIPDRPSRSKNVPAIASESGLLPFRERVNEPSGRRTR
jgi:hypothetical protein